MVNRLRIVGYIVQPQAMIDDGETLVPIGINPVTILAADWSNVLEFVAGGVDILRQQVEDVPQEDG